MCKAQPAICVINHPVLCVDVQPVLYIYIHPLLSVNPNKLFVFSACEHVSLFLCIYFTEDLLLQEDLIQIWPMINEANAMSEELDKKVKFEIILIAPQARGKKEGRTEVRNASH